MCKFTGLFELLRRIGPKMDEELTTAPKEFVSMYTSGMKQLDKLCSGMQYTTDINTLL